MGLQKGSKAPDFTLQDQHGNPFTLSDHIGKAPVVIFFYPKDFTPGCTAEACAFRDSYEQFSEVGAQVVGISSDSRKSHLNFAAKHRLPFVLLSDTKKAVRKRYQVDNRLFQLLPGRETFVIDRQGNIAMNFKALGASGHVEKALAAVRKL